MKKVGIATMYGGANYGNILQNYAVQELLREQGCQAVTLVNETKRGYPDTAKKKLPLYKKLRPSYIADYYRNRLYERYGCKNSRDCFGAGLRKAKRQQSEFLAARKRRFERFEQTRQSCLTLSQMPIESEQFHRAGLDEYDAFVCGSDQIWNPYFYQNSPIDFLQFAPEHKRIALVPSFGISTLPESRKAEFAAYLQAIQSLSVREKAGAQIIKELTGRDAKVLLDPTFGVTPKAWQAFAKKPQSTPDSPYVLCYFLGNQCKKYSRWIDRFAAKKNMQIVNIRDISDLRYYDTDPQEFVWLLANAQAVFTDSFHGVAFSINLQKPFVAFARVEGGASMFSRISTVLEKTGLTDRCYPMVSYEQVLSVDFKNTEKIIQAEREAMSDYLKTALDHTAEYKKPLLATRRHCTGCGACENACKAGALRLTADTEGFLYPQIDSQKCIGCNACERVCPADIQEQSDELPQVFFAYAKDNALSDASSSGGIFSLLARKILRQGGVVFGAGYDEHFRICHMAAENEEQLGKLRTSKYVQSAICDTYKQAEKILQGGRTVLFTGTPCQIAGLQSYLGKPYENLYTQDIICHGVPSPGSWERYLEQCHGEKTITAVNFRDKTFGWNNFAMRMTYADGTSYCVPAVKDPFERAFLANLNLRPSCYQCQYKTMSHASDLTLADYWGVELVHPELKEQQGVSLLLIHTPKGQKLLDEIAPQLNMNPTDREKAIGYNHGALHSVKWHKNRERFFAAYRTQPFAGLVEDCLRPTLKEKIHRFIRRSGSRVKKLLKKLKGVTRK